MSTSFPFAAAFAALPAPYQLREQGMGDAGDDAFAAALYRSTRSDLLQIPGDPSVIEQLISMQQRAQTMAYRHNYPQAAYLILQRGVEAIGRLILQQHDAVLHVVDIAILPQAQQQGAATAVLSHLQALASKQGLHMELAVNKSNQTARRLYQRLGFEPYAEDEVQEHLRWTPA